MEELTFEDMLKGMDYAKTLGSTFFEDDLQIIEVDYLGYPKEITLKPRGLEIINNFIGFFDDKLEESEVITIMGVKVIKS